MSLAPHLLALPGEFGDVTKSHQAITIGVYDLEGASEPTTPPHKWPPSHAKLRILRWSFTEMVSALASWTHINWARSGSTNSRFASQVIMRSRE